MLDILWWWTLQRHSSGCHLAPGCHVYQLSPKFMKPLSFGGTGGTKIWTPTLGWWPKRICPGPTGVRAWTHGTFGSLAMRSWNGWNGWNGRIFHRKTWQMRDRTGLRQYAAWMNCCSIFFKRKRRWWSMPAPFGDWSSWCWSCPYFDCTLVRSLTVRKTRKGKLGPAGGSCAASSPPFLWKSKNRTSRYGFWRPLSLERAHRLGQTWTLLLIDGFFCSQLFWPGRSLNLWHLLMSSLSSLLCSWGDLSKHPGSTVKLPHSPILWEARLQ